MIPPAEKQSKILKGKEKICQAFEMGEVCFSRWVERGLPVKIIDGRWTGHHDAIETFMKIYIESSCQ